MANFEAASQPSDVRVGVIGGSGFYSLFDEKPTMFSLETPYGPPSGPVAVGSVGNRRVAFLPRHGERHTFPPHRINYRANVAALRSLGVEQIVAPCAVGSLKRELAPGDVVICDQFLNNTQGRETTYFDGPEVAHLSAAEPYCAQIRPLATVACGEAGLLAHPTGTVAVIDGPRFSTRAESQRAQREGADVINMTQFPEVVLARESGMCYVALGLITDYDAGLGQPDVEPVTQEHVLAAFAANLTRLRVAVLSLVVRLPTERSCECATGQPVPINH